MVLATFELAIHLMHGKRVLTFVVVISAGLALTTAFVPADRFFRMAKAMEQFAEIFRVVNEAYVDELNPNTLSKKGMDEMLNTLDPYTNYFSEDVVEDARTGALSGYGGIGAESMRFDSRTVITRVFEGSPADKAGIKPGDVILSLDGKRLKDITHEEAGRLVRGQAGTSVRVEVLRNGSTSPETLELRRSQIQVKTVTYSGLCPPAAGPKAAQTGYIVLEQFGEGSGEEVAQAVRALRKQGAVAIILDLRGNPGGLLTEAVEICGLFLPKGKLVVTTRGRDNESKGEFFTPDPPIEPDMPVAVLVNRTSASASEIVAGTLQDYDRAVVIGERTYGKGLVQTRRPLSYNSVSMITTARYYTPSGRCIQVLDYSRRRADGSVGSVPDSVKKAFKTSRGRLVFDGGGIEPDVVLERKFKPELGDMLISKGHLIDFAARHRLKYPVLPPNGPDVNDALLAEFSEWLQGRSLVYSGTAERALADIKSAAAAEQIFDQVGPSFGRVSDDLRKARRNEVMRYPGQVRKMLAQEIARVHSLDRGAAAAGYGYDPEWQEAVKIVHNPEAYGKLLGGNR